MQQRLDMYIEEHHDVEKQDIFSKKLLALLVELGELANETRCFKFWSKKAPSKKQIILEEYVDVLHFMLSLGLEKGYRFHPANESDLLSSNEDTTTLFIKLFQTCTTFGNSPHDEEYHNMLTTYLALGNALDFQEEDIEGMYVDKNATNYQRQDEGY